VKAATKREAINAVRTQLMAVVGNQPVPHDDFDQAMANAQNVINNLKEDPASDIGVNVTGSIWNDGGDVHSCSVSCSAWLETRQPVPIVDPPKPA
jgi:hypothetical protein